MQEASVEIVEVLKRVRVRLSDPSRWTQGESARDRNGIRVSTTSPDACCWCLIGALCLEADRFRLMLDASERLRMFVAPSYDCPVRPLSFINDAPTTKHEHILRWLDTVIAYDSKLLGIGGE